MFVRKRLDLRWSDVAAAIGACLAPVTRRRAEIRVERRWSTQGDALACLSVRSGFDLLLRSLKFPAGSQILVSAVTIPHMVEIVRAHGLVPIPVDLDMRRLAVQADPIEEQVTPMCRAVLIAHLFGSRMPMEPVLRVARRHRLVVIEDCAQAFGGLNDYRGHPESDVVMHSFGLIKTATALGGGILVIRDRETRKRAEGIRRTYPVRSRRRFFERVVKAAALKAICTPRAYGAFVRLLHAFGSDHDAFVRRATRGFAGDDLLRRIRFRPDAAQLVFLERRLRRFQVASIERRRRTGEHFAAMLPPSIERPGVDAPDHSHWLFPVAWGEPEQLVERLARSGFDATTGGTTLQVVEQPSSRSAIGPAQAERVMPRLVYLPVYPEMPEGDLARLAAIVGAGSEPGVRNASRSAVRTREP